MKAEMLILPPDIYLMDAIARREKDRCKTIKDTVMWAVASYKEYKESMDKWLKDKIIVDIQYVPRIKNPDSYETVVSLVPEELYRKCPEDFLKTNVYINGDYVSIDMRLNQAIHHLNSDEVNMPTISCCSGHVFSIEAENTFSDSSTRYQLYLMDSADKTLGYIQFDNLDKARWKILDKFCKKGPYDTNRVEFYMENWVGSAELKWKVSPNREDIDYACKVVTDFIIKTF